MAPPKTTGWRLLPIILLTAQVGLAQLPLGFLHNTPTITDALVRDSAGNYFAGGRTSNVPTTAGAYMPSHVFAECTIPGGGQQDPCDTGFVAKFGPSGNMIWGTYLGTPKDEGDYVSKVVLGLDGSVWVDGYAASAAFPTTPNAYLSTGGGHFLAQLSADGSQLLYSTFLGSAFSCCSLGVAGADGLYFVGNGVVKFNPAANQILYTAAQGINLAAPAIPILAEDGTLYLAASTSDPNFPITPGVYSHPSGDYGMVLLSLDPAGEIVFSTVIGGSGAAAMARDAEGDLYISGLASPDLSLTGDAAQRSPYAPAGSYAAATSSTGFIMKLSPDATTLLYSSLLNAVLLEMKIGDEGKISGLGYTWAPSNPDGYHPCLPGAYGYVRLNAGNTAIEYSTQIPDNSGDGYPLVFDFDTSGTAYIYAYNPGQPAQFFTTADVSQAPHSGPVCMAESASNFETAVAPGLMMSIYGPGVGPEQPTPLALDANGRVATELAGTQILFDGMPAPILFAAPARVDVVVPFGVATSGNTTVAVLRNGNSVGTLTHPLSAESFWFFAAAGGQGSPAINQDGTPNSAQNPAKVGSTVSLFATGAGAMTPTPADGTIPQSPSSAIYNLEMQQKGPVLCAYTYAGDAPGLVEGIVQINCTIKSDFALTAPAVFTFSTAASYAASFPVVYRIYVTQ